MRDVMLSHATWYTVCGMLHGSCSRAIYRVASVPTHPVFRMVSQRNWELTQRCAGLLNNRDLARHSKGDEWAEVLSIPQCENIREKIQAVTLLHQIVIHLAFISQKEKSVKHFDALCKAAVDQTKGRNP
jgi:hypothetical protein